MIPTVDLRLVDPAAVGQWFIERRFQNLREYQTDKGPVVLADPATVPLSDIADEIPWSRFPIVSKGESLVQETTAKYLAELRASNTPQATLLVQWYDQHGTFEGVPTEPVEA